MLLQIEYSISQGQYRQSVTGNVFKTVKRTTNTDPGFVTEHR